MFIDNSEIELWGLSHKEKINKLKEIKNRIKEIYCNLYPNHDALSNNLKSETMIRKIKEEMLNEDCMIPCSYTNLADEIIVMEFRLVYLNSILKNKKNIKKR